MTTAKYLNSRNNLLFSSKNKYKELEIVSTINKGAVNYELINRLDRITIDSNVINKDIIIIKLEPDTKYKLNINYIRFNGSLKVRLIKI